MVGTGTVARHVLIKRVWVYAVSEFPFQEKPGRKEKPVGQLAHKNKSRLQSDWLKDFKE